MQQANQTQIYGDEEDDGDETQDKEDTEEDSSKMAAGGGGDMKSPAKVRSLPAWMSPAKGAATPAKQPASAAAAAAAAGGGFNCGGRAPSTPASMNTAQVSCEIEKHRHAYTTRGWCACRSRMRL